MAEIVDLNNLTLSVEEARSTSECVFENLTEKSMLSDTHLILTGVESDKLIPIFGKYGMTGKASAGNCVDNLGNATIPTSEKTWTPKLIKGTLEHCQDNIPDNMKFWKKSRIAANTWSEVNNEFMAFISDRVSDSILESQFRHAEFGDVNASPVGDATGDETLTVGIDKTYFNVLNGMWSQIFTDQAGAKLAYRYTIPENAYVTTALQTVLAADRALTTFRTLYNKIGSTAKKSTLVFQITSSLFNNWQDFLEDKSLVFNLSRAENGATTFNYRGIPIIVRDDWDETIKTYYDNGTTLFLPHRAVLASLNNIPIGTSDTESLTSLKSFYVEKDEKHYIRFAYKIDMKILVEKEIAVAY
ncbi:MAG: hypothetical protein OEL89_04960 [Candidatus Peregrinibacteria bacterium]|nr:hypothetical protein [Candidatus Peregrinibacteria bacterium]